MRTKQFFRIIFTAAVISGASLTATAQQPAAQTAAPQKQKAKPTPAKSAKVWTSDDLTSLRSSADIYTEEKAAQAAQAAAAAKQAATAKQPGPKPTPLGAPPALSNPKTPEDADKMIAWENRDIAAQQQFVEDLKKQVDQAPPDQKERLQNLLQQHIENLANTRKEAEGLAIRKQKLEKKPAAGNTAPAATPQSQ